MNNYCHMSRNISHVVIIYLLSLFKDPVVSTPTLMLLRCPEDNPLLYQEMCIMMDGIKLVQDDRDMDIINGLACLFSLCFVYGIQYPKGLTNTMKFLEKFAVKIDAPGKIPTTVLRAHSSLVA